MQSSHVALASAKSLQIKWQSLRSGSCLTLIYCWVFAGRRSNGDSACFPTLAQINPLDANTVHVYINAIGHLNGRCLAAEPRLLPSVIGQKTRFAAGVVMVAGSRQVAFTNRQWQAYQFVLKFNRLEHRVPTAVEPWPRSGHHRGRVGQPDRRAHGKRHSRASRLPRAEGRAAELSIPGIGGGLSLLAGSKNLPARLVEFPSGRSTTW